MGYPDLNEIMSEGNRRTRDLFRRIEYYLNITKDSEAGEIKDNLLRIGTEIYKKLKEVDGAFLLHGIDFLETLNYYESLMGMLVDYLTGKREKDDHYNKLIDFAKQVFIWK